METVTTVAGVRERVRAWKFAGERRECDRGAALVALQMGIHKLCQCSPAVLQRKKLRERYIARLRRGLK